MTLQIYTVSELMEVAAAAALEGDVSTLLELQGVIDGWMQPRDETEAQHTMVEAFIALIEGGE